MKKIYLLSTLLLCLFAMESFAAVKPYTPKATLKTATANANSKKAVPTGAAAYVATIIGGLSEKKTEATYVGEETTISVNPYFYLSVVDVKGYSVAWSVSDKSNVTLELNNTTTNGITYRKAQIYINKGKNNEQTYTATATYTAIKYNITYEPNGGTVSGTNPTTYTVETGDFTPTAPTKTGYTFTGWTWNGQTTPTKTVNLNDKTGAITLTANYELPTYNISYNLDGGTVSGTNPTSYTTETDDFTLKNPTKAGYEFTGWTWTGQTTPVKIVTIAKGSTTGNKAYKANYEKITYTITYILNGGTVSGTNRANYTVTQNDFTLKNPTKAGYEFTGWTWEGQDAPVKTVTIKKGSTTGNKTFIANYKVIEYSITYTLYGGTVSGTNPTSYTVETDDFTLINPTKAGYEFTGWTWTGQKNPVKTVTIKKGSTTDNKTYIANYKVIEYSITYALNGGTVSGTNPTSYTIETDDFTLINPTKAGYEFAGWTWDVQDDPVKTVTIKKGITTDDKAYTANFEYIYPNVTLNTAGLATYSAPENFVISTENVKAYSANIDWSAQTITLSEVEGAVPAGEGVLLYGTAKTQVSFAAPTTETVATLSGNGIKATTNAAGELVQMPTSGDVWALGTGSEFMIYSGNNFIHNRAYLYNDTQAPAKSLRMIFADKEATAINAVSADKANATVKCIENGRIVIKKNGVKYNVSGQMIK